MRVFQFSFLLIAILLGTHTSHGQRKSKAKKSIVETTENQAPKLVVGVVVDQMRYDYITRF